MVNKIKTKKVGEVNIFEIFGSMTRDFARRGREAIHQSMESSHGKNVLYNIRELQDIDQDGVEALLENIESAQKSAMLTGDNPAADLIQDKDRARKLHPLKDAHEVTRFFTREFAAPTLEEQIYPERRQFVRLKTALPLVFTSESSKKEELKFFAVITNLSEGGLFAQFIESASETGLRKHVNPYDLKLLHLDIGLIGKTSIRATGKIIHGNLTEGGIGIEFYDIDQEHKLTLRDWIAQHLMERGQLS